MLKFLLLRSKINNRLQTAQGIVEFALVLPILLMLVLGIIAFGHLFFVYSMTVSSSREAARFGSAVGLSANGIARYRDCAAIRGEAIRFGQVIGLTNADIQIQYDRGPTAPVNVYGNCPVSGTGPADANVRLGDRVVVTVTTQYTPIVPFIDLPSFPLSAVTARTIVKALPVGDVPPAQDACTVRTELEWSHLPNPSSSGIAVPFIQKIYTADGKAPGVLKVYADGAIQNSCTTNDPAAGSTCNLMFSKSGPVKMRWEYTSSNPCYPDLAFEEYHYVDVTPTKTTILPKSPNNTTEDTPVLFDIKVEFSEIPGNVTEGMVTITDIDKTSISCTAAIDPATGIASCYLTWTESEVGLRELRAEYLGTNKFTKSTSAIYKFSVGPRPKYLLKVIKDLQVGSSGAVFSSPSGIDCGFTCEFEYKEGTVIKLTAAADTGSTFVGWMVNNTLVNGPSYDVTLMANTTITAVFTMRFPLTTTVVGGGTITASPTGISCGTDCQLYVKGTQVTLTAQPTNPNQFVFMGWSGSVTGMGTITGNSSRITLTMDAAKSVTATFKRVDTNCPTVTKDSPSKLQFNIKNASTANYLIDNIQLTTPSWTTANTKLQEIRFNTANNSCGSAANCLFYAEGGLLAPPPGLDPPTLTFWEGAADPTKAIYTFNTTWSGLAAGVTKQMAFEFTNPFGYYNVTVTFKPVSPDFAPCVLKNLDNNYK